ncbi:hypothetical protein L7F22_064393 [Adiantum nelumboides]|nr:hypothetical protein [Adiantum nelumboides]
MGTGALQDSAVSRGGARQQDGVRDVDGCNVKRVGLGCQPATEGEAATKEWMSMDRTTPADQLGFPFQKRRILRSSTSKVKMLSIHNQGCAIDAPNEGKEDKLQDEGREDSPPDQANKVLTLDSKQPFIIQAFENTSEKINNLYFNLKSAYPSSLTMIQDPNVSEAEGEHPAKDKANPEVKQADTAKPRPTGKELQIPLMQLEEPTQEEAYEEVKNFDYTKIILTLSRQFQCQNLVAKETDFQKNQEPASAVASTSNNAALNTLTALQEELHTEKLQRQLLVSRFMTQTTEHETRVKELEQELAQAKVELEIQKQRNQALSKEKEAVDSLASTAQTSQAENHLHVHLPPIPDMPDLPGTSQHDEEHQGPAPGALDVRGDIEQNIEDMPEGPAKDFFLHEKKVMESAALAFLQPEEQAKGLGHDFLPLPLKRHEPILWKEKVRPALPKNEDRGYEGISLTAEQAQVLIGDHPKWRRKWLLERPNDLTFYHNTPQALQIDPTYFPVPRRRTWPEFQRWRGRNKSLLNYPVLTAQNHQRYRMW